MSHDPRAHLAGLIQQMAWADAFTWTAILNSAVAGDARLMAICHHVHTVQHIFRRAWAGEPVVRPPVTDFPSATVLAAWGCEAHLSLAAFLDRVTPDELEREFREPWTDRFEARFPRPAAPHTLGESVAQVVLHTAHHRGQALLRLRELGCDPPTIDFIVWLWAGKPPADWTCLDVQAAADRAPAQ